jgi:hypothetical protein
MSAYAQMMKKKGSMTKKSSKETPDHNLECKLLTDHGVPSPGAPKLVAIAADVSQPSEPQVARKKRVVLRNRAPSPTHSSQDPGALNPGH